MKDLSKLLSFLVKVLLIAVGIEFAAIYLFMERGEAAQPGVRLTKEWNTSGPLLSLSSSSDPMETHELLEEMTRVEVELGAGEWEGEPARHGHKSSASGSVLAAAEGRQLISEEQELARRKVVYHKVRRGENLWSIARAYELDVETILASNQLEDPNKLKAGMTLKMLPKKGFALTVKRGDSLWEIARTFNTDWRLIMEHNNLAGESLKVGQKLIIPWTQDTAQRRREIKFERENRFCYPMKSRVTSAYGWRLHPIYRRRILHAGIDFSARTGTSVEAARSGRVSFAGWMNGYGKIVIIKHKGGFSTRYAHLSKILVKKGAYVTIGKVIAKSGATGQVTGPHLHFEIRKNGRATNPMPYLKDKVLASQLNSSIRK